MYMLVAAVISIHCLVIIIYKHCICMYMYIVVSIVALKLNPKVKKISTTIIMLLSCVTVKD